MEAITQGPWKAKRLATYQNPGWVVLWPDKGGTHMRRLDSSGNFTGPDAALIAAAPELLALARAVGHKDLRMLQVYYNESAEDIAKLLE